MGSKRNSSRSTRLLDHDNHLVTRGKKKTSELVPLRLSFGLHPKKRMFSLSDMGSLLLRNQECGKPRNERDWLTTTEVDCDWLNDFTQRMNIVLIKIMI